jgi:porphobilinogen synthase
MGMNTTSPIRMRRLRANSHWRNMVATTALKPSDFVLPLFVRNGSGTKREISSMPGVFQMSPDVAVQELQRLEKLGLASYILFGVTDAAHKDASGSHAHDPDNAVCTTLCRAKDAGVSMVAMTDLCYCEYTSHGHCGPLTGTEAGSQKPGARSVDNDATVQLLGQQAVLHAKAGADVIAPSGMMDHAIAGIRSALDGEKFADTAIVSYAVKYASSFYGPFREAAESPPQFGDRKTYQMDFRRDAKEAIREATLDVAEGADVVMVKPAVAYLDILRQVADAVDVPCAAYHVSGEYAMIKAAAAKGWIDEKGVVLETMSAIKRAGASFILTYYAGVLIEWL